MPHDEEKDLTPAAKATGYLEKSLTLDVEAIALRVTRHFQRKATLLKDGRAAPTMHELDSFIGRLAELTKAAVLEEWRRKGITVEE
jgi:hypothetical protein